MSDKYMFDYQLYDNLVEVIDAIVADFCSREHPSDVQLISLVNDAVYDKLEIFYDECQKNLDRLFDVYSDSMSVDTESESK